MGAQKAQLLVHQRRFLAEEAIRSQLRGEPGHALEQEGTVPFEVLDEDLLHRPTTIHQLIERHVGGIETKVAARALVSVGILQDCVTGAIAPT